MSGATHTLDHRPTPPTGWVVLMGVAIALPAAVVGGVGLGGPFAPSAQLATLVVAALLGAVRGSDLREPRLRELLARGVGAVGLATLGRMGHDTLQGVGPWPDGTALVDLPTAGLVVLVSLVFALAVGAARTAASIVVAPTPAAEQAVSERLLGLAAAVIIGFLLLHALPVTTVPVTAQLAAGLAMVGVLLGIAGLRAWIARRPATAAPRVERPRGVVGRAALGALIAVVLLAGVLAPASTAVQVPDLRPALGWVGALVDGLFDGREAPASSGERAEPAPPIPLPPPPEASEPLPEREPRDLSFDLAVPAWVGVLLAAGVLALATGGGGFLRWLRAVAGAERGPDGATPTPPVDASAADRGLVEAFRARAQQVVARVRPRPRDPAAAIHHDDARLQRALARHDLARGSGETPRQHARRLAAPSGPVPAEPVVAFGQLLGAVRWSSQAPTMAQAEAARGYVDAILAGLDGPGSATSPDAIDDRTSRR